MCNKKSELLLAAISSAAAARKGRKKVRSGQPGVAAGKKKLSAWTGVRFRHGDKWATEIRVPRTREKVWIGTFPSPRQAALAYDAAVFCFYGKRTPKARKINFPDAPRPEISESERLQLSVADVKATAERHARDVDALLPPLADADDITAAPVDLVVAPVTPVAVDAPAAGAGGPAPPDSSDDDELDQLINDFDIDAFQAELDAITFLVSDDEYY